jgi:hypothetical protein
MWFCLGFRVESKSLNIHHRFLNDDDEIGSLSKGAKKNLISVIYRRRRLYEERREGKRERRRRRRRRRRPSSSSSPSPSLPLSLFLGGGRFGRRKRERGH